MARIVSKTVYQFSELSDEAKERAREWYRQGNLDCEWWESTYEDFVRIGEMLGIEFDTYPVKLMNGNVRNDPKIHFSGFCSQGDGASFAGHYSYRKGCVKEVMAYVPQDKELHGIVRALFEAQRRCFYGLQANISLRGHYSHSGTMSFDVTCDNCNDFDEDDISQPLRELADWLYRRLESEYDYLMSNEAVDESIEANAYEFDEDGNTY